MNLFPDVVGKLASSSLTQKASPEILLAAGAVSMVASTILACRATLKMDEVLAKAKHDLDTAKAIDDPAYPPEDRNRDIAVIYTRTAGSTLRLYAPAIATGAFGLLLLATGNRMHVQKVVEITAAYTALDKGFREYRGRVVEKYGEDVDQAMRYGTEKVEIEGESGRKKKVDRVNPDTADYSIYARFFDEGCKAWDRYDHEANMFFLKCQQDWANDTLKARGHIFLNEVYDMIQVPRSKQGAVVGWIYDRRNPDHEGDNFIDFGIFRGDSQVARDFVNGREGAILLDFNVDGIIYNKI